MGANTVLADKEETRYFDNVFVFNDNIIFSNNFSKNKENWEIHYEKLRNIIYIGVTKIKRTFPLLSILAGVLSSALFIILSFMILSTKYTSISIFISIFVGLIVAYIVYLLSQIKAYIIVFETNHGVRYVSKNKAIFNLIPKIAYYWETYMQVLNIQPKPTPLIGTGDDTIIPQPIEQNQAYTDNYSNVEQSNQM